MPIQLPIHKPGGGEYRGYVACAKCPGPPAAEKMRGYRIYCPVCKNEQDETEALIGCWKTPPDKNARFIRVEY